MKTSRIFATTCLLVSSVALVTAANRSVGDQPGVVRMSSMRSIPADEGVAGIPAPTPDPGVVAGGPVTQGPFVPGPGPGMYPVPENYAPYFNRSFGATQSIANAVTQAPFGPIGMYEANIDNGLGFGQGYHRANVRMPWHIVPNTTVLMGDLSAAVTNGGDPLFNYGVIYRNYDASRNRIFGWNVYGDHDPGYGYADWNRVGFGLESLGKYVDWRANGYVMAGKDSVLITDQMIGNLSLTGNTVNRIRHQTRENAYSGFDTELGGPLPILGRYGMNMYAGLYYLTNDKGFDTTGFQARWEALVTESVTVNTYLTSDDTFGTNSWVSLQFSFPSYRNRSILRPRQSVRSRLQDPTVRHNRSFNNIDVVDVPEAVVNATSGRPWNIIYVDPNAATMGNGTYESPFMTLEQAQAANSGLVDIIRVVPNSDDSGTRLTVSGGLDLYNNQVLMSSIKDYTLFTENGIDFLIPGVPTLTNLGPLISNPINTAGDAVVHLANNNTILGMRIDGANATGTDFGDGVANALPITNVNLTMNTFTNYDPGANLQDVSGLAVIDMNAFSGTLGLSTDGLFLTSAAGSTLDLLVRNNTATNNSGTGLNVIARPGSTINAVDPNGFAGATTGIVNNTSSNNGTGISVVAEAGATVNALVENNTATGNTYDGIVLESNAATFNLVSMRANTFSSNLQNGVYIHYLNGGTFTSVSEDLDGDGILDAGEDLNGNGLLDEGIVSNNASANGIAGICIFGEDASVGTFDIGGPRAVLGNTLNGNTGGGLLVDLQDTATAQVDALFNTIQGGSGVAGLTIVLDFVDPGQGTVVDANGFNVTPFDVTQYGFTAGQYDLVTNAILQTVQSYFRNVPTVTQNPLSSIPDGQELAVDFVIGDAGTTPSNGATEYYAITIGESTDAFAGLAGLAADIGNIRNANGQGPGLGLTGYPQTNSASAVGVYTNNIVQFSPLLNPPNALNRDGIYVAPLDQQPDYAVNALTSGDLTFTRRALGFIAAHELGHAVSLRHIQSTGANTPNGLEPI
ncbi:MAG: right-handed parallel beta-helix repeat-containing protein, partial [Planctomycetaceae bacterium]|nr:right-handed parallel beta-helix repeat-containing protein [Planctomycetaceae bacterium]